MSKKRCAYCNRRFPYFIVWVNGKNFHLCEICHNHAIEETSKWNRKIKPKLHDAPEEEE